MSKFRDVVVASAVTVVAAVGITSVGTGEATAGRLPGGHKTTVGIDNDSVTVKRSNEYVQRVRNVSNNHVSRSLWLSGVVTVTSSKNAGKFSTGYIVGCQVDVSSLELGGGLSGTTAALIPVISGSLALPLGPGDITIVELGDKSFTGGAPSSIEYSRSDITVNGCGGMGIARAYTKARTKGGAVIQTTLYGKPFKF